MTTEFYSGLGTGLNQLIEDEDDDDDDDDNDYDHRKVMFMRRIVVSAATSKTIIRPPVPSE